MKCIILIHDPSPLIGRVDDWSHSGGDPRVFIETKKIWESVQDDENFSIIFWRENEKLNHGEVMLNKCSRTIDVGTQTKGLPNLGKDVLPIYTWIFTMFEQKFDFDYVLMTCLNSWWSLPRLKLFLEKGHEFTGRINRHLPGLVYTSGAATILSKNITKLFTSHDGVLEEYEYKGENCDDVAVGYFLNKNGLCPKNEIVWRDILSGDLNIENMLENDDKNNVLTYRVKSPHSRHILDVMILHKIYTHFSNK